MLRGIMLLNEVEEKNIEEKQTQSKKDWTEKELRKQAELKWNKLFFRHKDA